MVDEKEWTDFYDLFVKHFDEDCDNNENNRLDAVEFELCIEEIPTVNPAFVALKKYLLEDEEKIEHLITVLSNRERGFDDDGLPMEISINLAEYMYFRRAALSWKDCVSNNDYIQKIEVKGCAFHIMLPFTPVNDNDLNLVWNAG